MKKTMNPKTSTKIAAILLIVHGLIEVSALFTLNLMTGSLVSFGGLDQAQIADNIGSIVALGILWGLTRFVAAWGLWTMKKWGAALGVAISLVTMVAAVTVIPAGVADTLFSVPTMILLFYAWFGSHKLEI